MIYIDELEIKDTTESDIFASYLDILLKAARSDLLIFLNKQMYIFLKQTVTVMHFLQIIPVISIGQRINQGNFHINLFTWRSI
jgi:hypothetical protein